MLFRCNYLLDYQERQNFLSKWMEKFLLAKKVEQDSITGSNVKLFFLMIKSSSARNRDGRRKRRDRKSFVLSFLCAYASFTHTCACETLTTTFTPATDELSTSMWHFLYFSYRLNRMIFGMETAFWFHVVNVVLHAIASILFTKICSDVIGFKRKFCLLAGIFFAIHPIHTESEYFFITHVTWTCTFTITHSHIYPAMLLYIYMVADGYIAERDFLATKEIF